MTIRDDDASDLEPSGLDLVLDGLGPSEPPPALRERLLATASTEGRYLPFVATLGRVFDLDEARARALLVQAADQTSWKRDTPPFKAHLDFAGGPRCGALRAGFVAMDGGALIPRHRHTERELTLVLEGAIRSDDRLYTPGQVLEMPTGSEHTFAVEPIGAVFAVLRGRVHFFG